MVPTSSSTRRVSVALITVVVFRVEACLLLFFYQDIARILRKVEDNFLAISRRSLVAMALCQQ